MLTFLLDKHTVEDTETDDGDGVESDSKKDAEVPIEDDEFAAVVSETSPDTDNAETDAKTKEDSGEISTLTYEGDSYTVTATYDADTCFSCDVELIATEYEKDSETYLERYAEAAELYGWEDTTEETTEAEADSETDSAENDDDPYHGFRLFNIGFYDEGLNEVEPAAAVVITITYLDQETEVQGINVTHFGDGGAEILEAETVYEDGAQTTTFSSDSFTDYGISVASISGESNITVGDVITLTSNSGNNNHSWTSSDTSVATVSGSSKTATVTALSPGTVTITHSYRGGSETFTITVSAAVSANSVVLSLGNSNGVLQDNDYSGGSSGSGGVDLRYTIDLSDAVQNADGTVTITLPSNSDLNSTFTVATDTNGDAITQYLDGDQAYDYKLVGWVNIATGEYYDVSGGSVSAIVDFNNSNVFYADWVAASYDYGDTSSTLGEDTSDFIKIEMFDYNELFNLYSATLTQNGLTSESWTDSGNLYSSILGEGSVLDKSFVFQNCKTNNNGDSYSSSNGLLGFMTNLYTSSKQWNWNNETTYDVWDVDNASDSALFDKLFDTSGSTIGTTYVGTANYLFQVDDDGYYYFDSELNGAAYNQSDERFYLSSSTTTVKDGSWNGGTAFFPYNEVDDYTSISNGTLNYWFGMHVEIDFYLPNDVGNSGGNQYNGEDMVFSFSGDDDVWVFIDDELVLNLSGIHSEISGTINFSTGEVVANGTTTSIAGDYFAGTHKLEIYYLERGAWDSNISIYFNLTPAWAYISSATSALEVKKVWQDSDGNEVAYTDTEGYPDILAGLYEKVNLDTNALGVYTYNGVTYEMDENDEYYENGVLTAYYEDGYLYILRDTEYLTYENEWTYGWELLDDTTLYATRELTTLENYFIDIEYEQTRTYDYWGIVGARELNDETDTYALADGLQLVITDAAQDSTTEYPDTAGYIGITPYTGYVLMDDLSIGTAAFSTIPTYRTGASYTYGVIWGESLPDDAVWTVELTGSYAADSTSAESYIPTFYLKNTDGAYLVITTSGGEPSLSLSYDVNDATPFSYNTLGELNTEDSTGLRITFQTSQTGGVEVTLEERQNETDDANAKLYTIQPITATGRYYTLKNTEIPDTTDITVVKTDGTEDIGGEYEYTVLSGAAFILSKTENSVTYYYQLVDGTTDEYEWVTVAAGGDIPTVTLGALTVSALENDSDIVYTLTETAAPSGYLNASLSFTFIVDKLGVRHLRNEGIDGYIEWQKQQEEENTTD